MGRYDEAIAELERARQLDPLSMIIASDSALPYFATRRFDKAAEILNKALEIDPNFARTHGLLSNCYRAMGRYEEAIAEMEKVQDLNGVPRAADGTRRMNLNLALLYEATGRKVDVSEILADIDERERRGEYVPAFGRAAYYAQIGDKEQGFYWLDKAIDERSVIIIELKTSPVLDNLRGDPRFADLVRRVGLPQ